MLNCGSIFISQRQIPARMVRVDAQVRKLRAAAVADQPPASEHANQDVGGGQKAQHDQAHGQRVQAQKNNRGDPSENEHHQGSDLRKAFAGKQFLAAAHRALAQVAFVVDGPVPVQKDFFSLGGMGRRIAGVGDVQDAGRMAGVHRHRCVSMAPVVAYADAHGCILSPPHDTGKRQVDRGGKKAGARRCPPRPKRSF